MLCTSHCSYVHVYSRIIFIKVIGLEASDLESKSIFWYIPGIDLVLAKAMAVRDLMALNHSRFIHPSHCFANLLTTESPVNVAVQ